MNTNNNQTNNTATIDELKERPIWMVASSGKGGAKEKQPLSPHKGMIGSTTNPLSWGTYDQAKRREKELKDGAKGVGFVIGQYNDDYQMFFIDLDADKKSHLINRDALGILALFSGKTYIERSISGNGIHIYGLCKRDQLPPGRYKSKKTETHIEQYTQARYAVYTGDETGDSAGQLTDQTALYLETLDKYFQKEEGSDDKRPATPQNPLEKQNEVGLFCRAYDPIQEAIDTFLSDEYAPTADPKRYTYIKGSAEAGLVIYDDVFAYDNHATSPTSGELCNAFDLVRIHKFRELDEHLDGRHKNPKTRPSYLAMLKLMENDERVKEQKATETAARLAQVETEFSYEDVSEKNTVKLQYGGKDYRVLPTINNVFLILTETKEFKGKLYSDTFAARDVICGKLPWNDEFPRDWSDTDTQQLRRFLEIHYDGLTNQNIIESGIVNACQANRRHPVRDYLNNLPEWDGVERVEELLVDYLGAENTEYVRTVTKTHLVAAVARVMEPGVKYDTMITISGGQGLRKSTFIRLLCSDLWFNDSLRDFNGKDPFELIQGSWMVEIGELAAYKKSEKEEFKMFLSKTADRYRPPYGKRTIMQPRQCIFWGTTNDPQFLRDITGERRIWPIAGGIEPIIKDVFEDLPGERDQIWAEALKAYTEHWPLFLDQRMEDIANKVREGFKEEDARIEAIEEFLERPIPTNWEERDLQERLDWLDGYKSKEGVETMQRNSVTAIEIWVECFRGKLNDFPRRDNNEIINIVNSLPVWKKTGRGNSLGKAYNNRRPHISFVRTTKKSKSK